MRNNLSWELNVIPKMFSQNVIMQAEIIILETKIANSQSKDHSKILVDHLNRDTVDTSRFHSFQIFIMHTHVLIERISVGIVHKLFYSFWKTISGLQKSLLRDQSEHVKHRL